MVRLSSKITFTDLTGGINNVDTKENLNATPKKTQTPDMVNVEYFKLGGIKTMEGNVVIGSVQPDAIVGGWEYTKGNNRYMLIGLHDGTVKRFDTISQDFIEIYKFATASDRMSFCNMNNGVVISNGKDDLIFYEYGRNTALTGDVDVTNGSTSISGNSTSFGTDVKVGDYIAIEGCKDTYKVTSITDSDDMEVTPAIDTSYDTIYYQFYDDNNAVSVYSTVEIPEVGDTLYFIDTDTDPYTITTAGTVTTAFDPETNNMYYIDTNNVSQSAIRPEDYTDITVTTTPATLSNCEYRLTELSECNAILTNSDPEVEDDPKQIRGLALQVYNGRLWVGGEKGLFYSGVGLYNGWDVYANDAGYIPEIYNDSSTVTALGLFSEFLMIHKQYSSYILTCQDEDSASMSIKPFSNITCESQQSWIVSNTKYFVYSDEFMDIYPLVQHTIFNDKFLGEPITQKVRNLFINVNQADADKIFCVSRPKFRQMIFYLPTILYPGSNYGLIYDFQTKSWLLRVVPQDVTIAFNFNNNVYIGTRNGLVLREFSGRTFQEYDEDKDEIKDLPINAYYKSPWFDWSDGYMQSFAEFLIEIDGESTNKFYIRTQKDGQSRFEDRIIDNDLLNGNALVWDSEDGIEDNNTVWGYPKDDPEQGIYYNQTIGDEWVKATFDNIRMLLPNNVFEDFQIEIGTNELGQGFSIYGYQFRRIETEEAPW